jgi:hypothetical protein
MVEQHNLLYEVTWFSLSFFRKTGQRECVFDQPLYEAPEYRQPEIASQSAAEALLHTF